MQSVPRNYKNTFSAENNHNETEYELTEIVKWVEDNSMFNAWKDIEKLRLFLKCCKNDVERTKLKIKCFYQMRIERTEWFTNRNPFSPEIQELLKLGVFLPLDGVEKHQYKVVIIRTAVHNYKLHTQNNVFKVSKMVLDLLLKFEPENCANGIVAIFDMTGVQLGHALQLNPRLIKRSVECWQAYPCQPKLLEFINAPNHVNAVLNIFKFFMTSKMRSRVFVRGRKCTVETESLPVDIGGSGPSYRELTAKWKNLVESNADFYVGNGV